MDKHCHLPLGHVCIDLVIHPDIEMLEWESNVHFRTEKIISPKSLITHWKKTYNLNTNSVVALKMQLLHNFPGLIVQPDSCFQKEILEGFSKWLQSS